MKAISLWQPWASLWCTGIKVHETRHWSTNYRGWLLVHAAKRKIDDLDGDRLGDICNGRFGHHYGMDLPRGAIVGRVHMVACKRTADLFISTQPGGPFKNEAEQDDYECGDFAHGRFAWQADKFELFANPIPYRGAQGFFDVPDDLIPKLAA